MRVLHVSTVCGYGGVETVLASLVPRQQNAGLDPEVFFLRDIGGSSRFSTIRGPHFGDEAALGLLIRQGAYDVVHGVTHMGAILRPALDKAKYGGGVVQSCHQCGLYDCDIDGAAVTAVSQAAAVSIQDKCGTRVEVVRNGVDTGLFHPGDGEDMGARIAAWVGRSDDQTKDFPGFVALANALVGLGFRSVVVDGSPADGSAARAWLPAGTQLIDRMPWEQMPDFYRGVRASNGLLVSTSQSESCGLNLLEAQACGCPVVAPRVGGIPEHVVHGSTGYLYDRARGAAGILEAIEWLYAGDRYEQVSESAAEYVTTEFSAEAMCRRYLEVYERAISARVKRR